MTREHEPDAAARADGLTLGVEEEFLLIDPADGTTVARADRVLENADRSKLPAGVTLQRELRRSQVEAATGICTGAGQLRDHLAAGRRVLADSAEAVGALVVPVANAPLRANAANAADDESAEPRYALIDRRYAALVWDYDVCGLHVHVGVTDRDRAVAVVNQVNRWLPTLLALSVNSPFHDGNDTGHDSWRIVRQSRFPGSGLAPHLTDHRAWLAEVARLVDCGVLADERQTFWFARPSPHLPTVEFRVADTAATVADAVTQALLCRALVRTALAELDRGRPAGPVPEQLARAAVWSAARYGLSGPGIDLARGVPVPAAALVNGLLEHTRDALADTGDTDTVHAALRRHRSGAARQRELAATVGLVGLARRMACPTGGRRDEPTNAGMPWT